jgi:predicted transposase YbfD/YdcC
MARIRSFAILTHFSEISDPRVDRTKYHNLQDMIVVAICAAICGANGWADVERFGKAKIEWLRQFVPLKNGVPSHDTFGRVFAMLDTAEFYTCMHNWLRNFRLSLKGQHVAIDGKTLRGSHDRSKGFSALHMVSAWASGLRLNLGQNSVDDKSNEIPAVAELLRLLQLKGAIVTLDAMHCQADTAELIRKAGADYILMVKGNQPTLHETLMDLFMQYEEVNYKVPGLRCCRTTETNHGRLEERIHYAIRAPRELREKWKDLQTVGMVYRRREFNGKIEEEAQFFIASLPPRVRDIAKFVRDHWKIENNVHWVLDVTFGEDSSRIRTGTAPELASVFRRIALTILQQDTTVKDTIRGKRMRAGWDCRVLESILLSSKQF